MSWNESNNSPLVWQMRFGSVKTYVLFQTLQRLSVNWQSEKNYNLTGHSSYVFSTERKDIYRNVCNHTKARHHQCAKAISLILVEKIQMKKGEPDKWTELAKTHVIRHSYSDWSGITAVLIIEQVRLCFLKSIGGFIHGRKWSEAQPFTWLLSQPTCFE